ncbi:minor tail protein [Arthrobacter phage Wollypog]|uniref:Minor tail protein n=1 Tax=Arthrobacter phage Wollypog TaxID=2790985 RepID=A0A7T3KD49_9CAUD|nr:minor tail protein [Arthrobacter phage Wollypog]QPX62570.1 minor tail protein [Arthrobacter phage Wollypog]
MAINFDVVPEPDLARVAIQANNGTPGDSFFILRRDRNGSRLVRETSEAGVVWQSDPSSLRTNYATNPGLEAVVTGWTANYGTSGGNTVKNLVPNPDTAPNTTLLETGRNRFTNPRFVGNTAGIPTGGSTYAYLTTASGSRTSPDNTMLITATGQAPAARYGVQWTLSFSGSANVPVTIKGHMERTQGLGSGTMWITFYNAGVVVNPTVADANWQRIDADSADFSYSVTPSGNFNEIRYYMWIENPTGATQSGTTTIEFSKTGVFTGDTGWNSETTVYFDGSMADGTDSFYSWAGTADASESIRQSYGIGQFVNQANTKIFAMDYNGQPSLAVWSNNSSIDDTYASIVGDSGALRMGLTPGKTYRMQATYNQNAPQTGTINADARRIVVYTKVGTNAAVKTYSNQAPNVAGSVDLVVNFTVPAGATEAYVRLYNGTRLGNGASFWSSLILTDVAYNGPQFSGENPDDAFTTYTWDGAVNASSSTRTSVVGRTKAQDVFGDWLYQVGWSLEATGGQQGIAYTENVSGVAGDNWSTRVKTRTNKARTVTLVVTAYNGASPVGTKSSAATAIAGNAWLELVVDGLATTGSYTSLKVEINVTGSNFTIGDWIQADDLMLEKVAASGAYFDGGTDDPAYSGWNGTVGNSTSWIAPSALPITLYDYEARQGLDTDYVLTDELGNIGASETITIPKWGTWLKDPFRPFMNVKVLWNSDDTYTRQARRELLLARGAKYPVPQWDVRMAPSGPVVVATETTEEAIALTSMLDRAGVIMLDVAEEFGVPIRYASVGDISGSRASSDKDRSLTWEARLWTLDLQEVDYPVGQPVGQGLTYASIAGTFDSYLALATSVATYEDLAAGNWGSNV